MGHNADAVDNPVRILRTGVVGRVEHEMRGVYVKRLKDVKNVSLNPMRTWRMLKKELRAELQITVRVDLESFAMVPKSIFIGVRGCANRLQLNSDEIQAGTQDSPG